MLCVEDRSPGNHIRSYIHCLNTAPLSIQVLTGRKGEQMSMPYAEEYGSKDEIAVFCIKGMEQVKYKIEW